MSARQFIAKIYWVMDAQFGIDPIKFLLSLKGLGRYIRNLIQFKLAFAGQLEVVPCLHDWYAEAGSTKDEYFWQDLVVARMIFAANPAKHVDVGSRLDGFVAHVASFRDCEVFDVRPVSTVIPGVVFRQADLMNPISLPIATGGYCDSLSCLHAIEHFGLGRYGDPVNPNGYQCGIANMVQLLRPDGIFYLSTPIGRERVEFNANWVFDPRSIISCAEAGGMVLQKLIIMTPENGPLDSAIDTDALANLALQRYQLGLFIFIKRYGGFIVD